jgi:ornithine cyclodeaminase/alanine dehydrogenase-like protein (mu-crystallin family)
MLGDDNLLYLSSDDVIRACEEIDSVAEIRDALTLHADGLVRLPNEAYLDWQPPNGGYARTINMPGFLYGPVLMAGTKIINSSTDNPVRGLPRASGMVLLFDVSTARPYCLMEASHISSLRTASVSVLAAQHLLNSRAAAGGFLGAGALTRQHAMLMARRVPQITSYRIFDIAHGRAEALCSELNELAAPGRVAFEAVGSASSAVAGADLVVTCTTTREGYVRRDWLKDGCLAVNISLDDLCEDVLLSADRLYIDDWDLVTADTHRLLGKLIRAGVIGAGAVTGTIGQLILGTCEGRSSDEELCVVNPFGMAIEDISLANRVYHVANMRSLGIRLPR